MSLSLSLKSSIQWRWKEVFGCAEQIENSHWFKLFTNTGINTSNKLITLTKKRLGIICLCILIAKLKNVFNFNSRSIEGIMSIYKDARNEITKKHQR